MTARGVDNEGGTGSIAKLIELFLPARRIVAFTGAGISTESGIPDYRGPNGVWATGKVPALNDFEQNAETRREYWEARRVRYPEMVAKRPNPGHLALAALERAGRLASVITQNIDGLHQAAGNDPARIHELHGTSHMVRCLNCHRRWSASRIHDRLEAGGSVPPGCEVCGGPLRAATVLFGESLPRETLLRASMAAQSCDAMLVVGSSLIVNPAARLPLLAKQRGAALAIVNHTPTPADPLADVIVRGDAGFVLTTLTNALLDGIASS
ncbi:MAG TPA: Sir2 family NAD-dependent protein deacetylase [Thermomicrobiales bacterium]|nr:Sir2 family NAD-dependent protein deacetylase [Thermomicrobiales bacterium]